MNRIKKTVLSALSVLMITGLCGCGDSSSGSSEVSAETKAEAKKLVDAFYAGLNEADPVEMTTSADGEVQTVFTREGTKIRYEDRVNNYLFYLFEENGKKYFLSDDMNEPTEEEYTYELYGNSIGMALSIMATGYFQDEEQEEGVTYSAVQKDVTTDGKTESELKTVITAQENGVTGTITSTGKKTDDKVTHVTFEYKEGEQTTVRELDFRYEGVSVELPEYEIFDISEYYEHVESPFTTFEEAKKAVNAETLAYTIFDDLILAVVNSEGKLYQLSTHMDEATAEAYNALDLEAEDYSEQVDKLLDPLAITDCVDFTALGITQETLDTYAGKTIGELIDEGFGHNGYTVWDDSAVIYLDKNDIVYAFEVTLPEGFDTEADYEFEDLYDCVIVKGSYYDTNTTLLPLK